ncbi:adenosine kinase [Chamaesiphon minutus]|uniref:Sugar kinase, ribokinase n=1 Tax=Chamaesiphon minutus (strain ATCC 27169 / PCC 6605) TaxID=1173020 RepID=K9UQ07_CHAP6|nr:adenosine kinase [Chamaesiphon minutus]AFY96758.1 sugar kinase, ribokinase [Chamaesiphon minutus PCC 6605]
MTRYDVYGLGNALLDVECEVEPEVLVELGIDKGVMTLLDEASQNKILARLGNAASKRTCGGSGANTIVAVSQFGGKAFYSCKVAKDEPGEYYLQDLLASGVDTNLKVHPPEPGITGKCLVFVTPDADRSMNTFLGISSSLSEVELVPEAIANSAYTYIEGYLVTGETSKQAAITAREMAVAAGRKVALTLSDQNMAKFFKQGLLDMLGPGVDLLFANDSEAFEMAGTQDLATAIEYLKTISKTFALTLGAKGSVIFDGQTLLEIAPFPVKAIDTVGAGDMYAGGVLYGITNGMDWVAAGRLGSRASAQLVTILGARMETANLQALLKEVKGI